MWNENIWVMRWVFDPVHKWHINAMISSIETLTLSKLYVIIKFIWEKDPLTSIDERLKMMKEHLNKYNLPIEVYRQNIKWHTEELLELNNKHWWNIINICWSDKVIREMDVYWHSWNTFWMVCRPEFKTYEKAHKVSIEKWIKLVEVNPLISTSSTVVREWFSQGIFFQKWIDENVSEYIYKNWLYLPHNNSINKEKFNLWWFLLLDRLIPLFPELKLLEIDEPVFNTIQSKNAWKEKYIRTIVKACDLKWGKLVKFVRETEKLQITL